MYAIVETGGKQIRLDEGAKVRVELLDAEIGQEVTLDKVLMVGGTDLKIGAPYVQGAQVTCEVIDQGRGEKVIVFRKWRRNDARRTKGHRQSYTELKVKAVKA